MAEYNYDGTVQYGSEEDDVYSGHNGVDEFHGEGGLDWVVGWAGNDLLYGGDGSDLIYGGEGRDTLEGEAGNDLLFAHQGADRLHGGDNDGLVWDGAFGVMLGDHVAFANRDATAGAVADLRTGIVYNDGYGSRDVMTGIESMSGNSAFVDKLYGNDGANLLSLGAGDIIEAFGGDDLFTLGGGIGRLDGGHGTDTLLWVSARRQVLDSDGDGYAESETREGGITIDLAAGTLLDMWGDTGTIVDVENIGGTSGSQDDVLLGDAADNEIRGLGGSDRIDGRDGVDTVSYADFGSTFHYSYHSGHGAVEVDLAAGYSEESALKTGTMQASTERFGRDELANIENIVGSGLGDRLLGNDGDNLIDPGAGNDFVDGRRGVDTVSYASARSSVVVDLAARTADQAASGAAGRVVTEIVDGENVERLIRADDAVASRDRLFNIENAIGSGFDDRLVGDAGANRLDGAAGNDVLVWSGGGDTLIGGAGSDTADYAAAGAAALIDLARGSASIAGRADADSMQGVENAVGTGLADRLVGTYAANRLDGGGGDDRLEGGAGNDVYVVDSRRDTLVDTSGTDRVETSVSFTLAEGFENLVLTGSSNLYGVGNSGDNRLTGNDRSNHLSGGRGGADTLVGGGGGDTYLIDSNDDRVVEDAAAGIDLVRSKVNHTLAANVENLTFFETGAIFGTGNALANRIVGNSWNNVLAGGGGDDWLFGGWGNDSYLFNTALRTAGVDWLDFSNSDDMIRLDRSVFSEVGDIGRLRLPAFCEGTQAQDAGDRIIYDDATGRLFYDADGTGEADAILFATVEPGRDLTAANIIVVA